MTAFSDGMKKAGIDTDAAELYVAGAEALSKYKTEAKALPLLVAFVLKNRGALNALCREKLASIAVDMAAKSGSGQMATVQKDQLGSAAPASEPMPGEGQDGVAQRGREINADARQPLASGEGQWPNVREDPAAPAPPAREPSATDIVAMREAADITYFQMIRLRSKLWSTYRFQDLKNVRSTNLRENLVVNDVIDYGRTHRIKEDSLVMFGVPVAEMKKIIKRAETSIHTKAQ